MHGGDDEAAVARRDPNRPVHLLVILIGGADSDPTPRQIEGTAARSEGNSGLFQLAGDITRERIVPEYFNWNGTRAGKITTRNPPGAKAICHFIREHLQNFPSDKVAIVGNSWGGHTALEVVQLLGQPDAPLAVRLVVFLDASSTARGPAKPKHLPVNVHGAVNYFTHSFFVWGKWDAGTRIENIDLGDPKNHYMQHGEPAYHARFDVRAHVAAEWDQAIHDEIKLRLPGLLPAAQEVGKTTENAK